MNAVFYARVSTEEEKQINALEKQCADLKDCIALNHWKLIDSYVDEGKSGTSIKKRDEYTRLFNDLDSDKFDVIVIKSQDRLMRNVKDWYIFVDKLVTNGKKLYIYMENSFYKTDDSLITGIKAILAAEYSRDLSKKLNNAHKRREYEGSSVMTNGTMIGYDQINGELVINEKEAEIVKLVYNLYLEGNSIKTICKKLEDMNILNSHNKRYGVSTIRRMLRNEKYKGTMICNKYHKDFDTKKVIKNDKSEWIIHEHRIPIIIEETMWNKVQALMNSKSYSDKNGLLRGKKESGSEPLRRKLVCGECGANFGIYRIKKHSGTYTKKCMCRNFAVNGRIGIGQDKELGCNMPNISYDKLESAILDIIKIMNINPDEIIGKINENKQNINPSAQLSQLQKVNDNIIKNKTQRELLLDKYLDGIVPEDIYKSKMQRLENDLEHMIQQRNHLENTINKDQVTEKEFEKIYKQIKESEIDFSTFCSFIEKIVFYKNCTYIYLIGITIPIKIEESLQYNRKNTADQWIAMNNNRYTKKKIEVTPFVSYH